MCGSGLVWSGRSREKPQSPEKRSEFRLVAQASACEGLFPQHSQFAVGAVCGTIGTRIRFGVPFMNPVEQPENEAEARTPQLMPSGAGNVDKIRDILFGNQMRDYETRFARLEETVAKETAEMRESSRRRFDQLEQYIKREFET